MRQAQTAIVLSVFIFGAALVATDAISGEAAPGSKGPEPGTLFLYPERIALQDGIAETFAEEMGEALGITVTPVDDLASAVGESDVCVTCTPSKEFFLKQEWVPPGAFVAAVGADSPGKQEIDPRLMASSSVVMDILEQCAKVGELHHAIAGGLMKNDDVHAELGEVIAGQRPGRSSSDEITIFGATGTGLQDAAGAAAAYERAVARGTGSFFDFFSR